MLAPRFTLRAGLVWLTLGSVAAVVLREAMRETPWAIGVAVAMGSVLLCLLLHALAFWLSLALTRSAGSKK